MEPMKIEGGMTCKYWDGKCVLEVRILEYEELVSKERFVFEVLKNLSQKAGCSYNEGDKFPKERDKDGEKGLWGLIFNS